MKYKVTFLDTEGNLHNKIFDTNPKKIKNSIWEFLTFSEKIDWYKLIKIEKIEKVKNKKT